MTTRERVARRAAGVLAGVVLGGATLGLGVAHADGIVWGCPSGYTLDGLVCRGAGGSTVGALGLLPGDMDPVTGEILLPGTTPEDPTSTPPTSTPPTSTPPTSTPPTSTPPTSTTTVPPTSTTTVPPTSTTVPPVATTTAPPGPVATTVPPVVRPCRPTGTTPAVGNADVARTAAAVAVARARLAADVRRGAAPAVIRADGQALAAAIRDHAAALTASKLPSGCPTR